MNNSIDRKILLQRIMKPAPNNSHVVAGSTPVVSFGDLYSAHTVSIGINPSVDEFMSRQKPRRVLEINKKRLVDYESLGLSQGSLISESEAEQILQGSLNYFTKNPYHWFNKMEKYLIEPSGASYFDGTAAHLDLVQWATDPVWQNIEDKNVASELIKEDIPFLRCLLAESNYRKILLNGSTVIRTVKTLGLFTLSEVGQISYGRNKSLLFRGQFGKAEIYATTLNVPSAHGLLGPQLLADWLGR